jgi:alpha-ketoglutaric semialdehyde dehydrogenase
VSAVPATLELRTVIGGAEVAGEGPALEVRNPADPAELVASGRASSPEQAAAALDAAAGARERWAAVPAQQRGEVLRRAGDLMAAQAEELARLLTREEGKTLTDSRVEVQRAATTLRFYGAAGTLVAGDTLPSAAPSQLLFTRREPMGIVVLITPWNFPLAIPTQKVAPALVAGNTVVLKPATATPAIALRLAALLVEAGLPDGVLSVITGSGATVGAALVGGDGVRAVSFTGSYPVGRDIATLAAPLMIRVQLEMGGKNPLVVMDDADLDLAATVASRGAFGLTGQSCTATGLVLVHERVYEPFLAALSERAAALRVGNGLEPGVEVGPKVSRAELERGAGYVTAAVDDDEARPVRWREPAADGGWFLEPAVLADVRPGSALATEELFSPVACVLAFETFDEAIGLCNASRFGLAASICTSSLRAAHEFVDRVDAGIVKVNAPTTGLEIQMPFGGFKHSSASTYKELGLAALDFYTREKSAYLNYP